MAGGRRTELATRRGRTSRFSSGMVRLLCCAGKNYSLVILQFVRSGPGSGGLSDLGSLQLFGSPALNLTFYVVLTFLAGFFCCYLIRFGGIVSVSANLSLFGNWSFKCMNEWKSIILVPWFWRWVVCLIQICKSFLLVIQIDDRVNIGAVYQRLRFTSTWVNAMLNYIIRNWKFQSLYFIGNWS